MKSDSGQASTEYILMLAVAIMSFFIVYRGLILPAGKKLQENLDKQITQMLSHANLHQIRLGR